MTFECKAGIVMEVITMARITYESIIEQRRQHFGALTGDMSEVLPRYINVSTNASSKFWRQNLDTIAIWRRMVIKETCGTLHIRTQQCEATDPATNFSKLYHLHRIQRDAPYSLSGFLSREHSVPSSTFRLFLSVNAPLQRARNSNTALIL